MTDAIRRRRSRAILAAAWSAVAGSWIWHLRSTGKSPTDSLQDLVDAARGNWWAIPAYVAVYAARPLVLFPASLLTIAGGILFGPLVGSVVVVIASNLSAMIAFQVGRTLSAAPGGGQPGTSLLGRWRTRMQERSFVTVMIMRLAFLPYDLVNYASGYLRINPGAFLAATAIGSLPGTVSFVLAGASLDRVDQGLSGFDARVFVASVALFVVSLGVAKLIQRREGATTA